MRTHSQECMHKGARTHAHAHAEALTCTWQTGHSRCCTPLASRASVQPSHVDRWPQGSSAKSSRSPPLWHTRQRLLLLGDGGESGRVGACSSLPRLSRSDLPVGMRWSAVEREERLGWQGRLWQGAAPGYGQGRKGWGGDGRGGTGQYAWFICNLTACVHAAGPAAQDQLHAWPRDLVWGLRLGAIQVHVRPCTPAAHILVA